MMCASWTKTIILVHVLIYNYSLCSALPANDGAGIEEDPLPGRTDVAMQDNGRVTGFIGDDKLPKHMAHLQASINEFPRNAGAYPYDKQGDKTRAQRMRGVPEAPLEPTSREPQVIDEKTFAMQGNPNWPTDTTLMYLPKYEAGGGSAKLEQERRDKYLKEHPEVKKYPSKPLPEGALKTEGALGSSIYQQVLQYETDHKGQKAAIDLKANPGWLVPADNQHRGHEAPAVLMKTPFKLGQASSSKPSKNDKSSSKRNQQQGQGSEQTVKAGLSSPASVSQDTRQQQQPRREGLRSRPQKAQDENPSIPRNSPNQPKSKANPGSDPNNYLRFPPSRTQYPPGEAGRTATHFGPAPDKVTLQRIPPRPMNRLSDPNAIPPKQPPESVSADLKSSTPLKAVPGGRSGKEGTSFEAPEGRIAPHPAIDTSAFADSSKKSPAIDVSTWKPYNSPQESSSKDKGKAREPSHLDSMPVTLPFRPNPQRNPGEAPKEPVPQTPLARKGKENQKPDVSSPVSGRLRSKQDPAVRAAQKAMAGTAKKKSSKDKRDLLVYLLNKRRLAKRMSLMEDFYELDW